ncbi:MAG TPA: zf-HC2 domain-containing protein [Egibacteraceae bacterium]|nr:zf-HC2 domain-containing protein [Actinomycetota bacterium]HWB71563.1 zf-HC2 domain-containing protein [Egibacteraceae bacterium]
MISCSDAVQQLWDFLEREVSAEDAARIEEHLNVCRRCCGELEFAEELRRFLASHARPEMPDDVEGRLTAFLHGIESA